MFCSILAIAKEFYSPCVVNWKFKPPLPAFVFSLQYPSSLTVSLVLKLTWFTVATPAFLWLVFAWYRFFFPFLYLWSLDIFIFKMGFWQVVSCFFIQSDSFHLLTGLCTPIAFNVVINVVGLKSTALLAVFYLFQ